MNLSPFFNSYAGMYVAQSFCHSVIASIIADQAVKLWKIDDPGIRQRFRLIVVLFPIFSFPLYQVLNPGRSSVLFRLSALFDINRWLNMEIWGIIPFSILFLIVLAITSLIFLFQEMVPVLRHTLESKHAVHDGARTHADPFIERASNELSIETPEMLIVDDDEPVILSTTGKNPAILISTGLSKTLTPDEMQAALAHEIAHIARSRRPVLLVVFLLRVIMFFNPVVLVEFRRVVRNEEKICDDIAVSITNRPEALAEALKKFYTVRDAPGPDVERPLFTPVRLEEYSYNMQLDTRITRLEQNTPRSAGGRWFSFMIVILIIAGISYFVV
ncbi:MAG TPA: M56 family metallopeptidase [Nitrospirota bacterium]|nr:M56 family metallopeptidase [Nitrospirota bacterium]